MNYGISDFATLERLSPKVFISLLKEFQCFSKGEVHCITAELVTEQRWNLFQKRMKNETKHQHTSPEPTVPSLQKSTTTGQHFHMDFGFVRGSDYSRVDSDGKLITSVDGYRAYLIIVDSFSGYMWVMLKTLQSISSKTFFRRTAIHNVQSNEFELTKVTNCGRVEHSNTQYKKQDLSANQLVQEIPLKTVEQSHQTKLSHE